MNAFSFLAVQRRRVKALFDWCQVKNLHAREREAVFVQLLDQLATLSSLKERYVYPYVEERLPEEGRLQEMLEGLYEQKRSMARLVDLPLGTPKFSSALATLRREVELQWSKEDGLFLMLRSRVPADELSEWGKVLARHAKELWGGEPPAEVEPGPAEPR